MGRTARFLGVLLLLLQHAAGGSVGPRVAVVGAGVGGATATHFLRKELGEAVEIDVFEEHAVGGRAHSVEVEGQTVELGASIIHAENPLLSRLATEVGLEKEAPPSGHLALYDGRTLVFRESDWWILNALQLFWRYLFAGFTFRRYPGEMLERFKAIYALQDSGSAWRRPEDLLREVGLYDLTQDSMLQYLRETIGSSEAAERWSAEVVAGVNLVNYGQPNSRLNALAGLVSMLPATDPRVFRIKGGNQQLASRLIQAANATLSLPARVEAIARLSDGRFELLVARGQHVGGITEAGGGQGGGGSERQGPYDAVVVATPLEGSGGLSFHGIQLPHLPARKYWSTVTTLVKGDVRPSFFGLADMEYDQIMVTEDAGTPFNSLARVATTANNETIWKLFSTGPAPLPTAWLEMMFEAGFRVAVNRTWHAYPAFDPPENFSPAELAEGVYYTNGLENAASALEVAAIWGRNGAALAAQYLRRRALLSHRPGGAAAE